MNMFDADKNRMIGFMVKKNYDDMLSRFHLVPERNGRTDRQTNRRICYAISISRVSMLTIKMIHYTVLRERKPPTRRLRSTGPSIHVKDWGHAASAGNAATGPL